MKSTILQIIVKEWFKDRLGGELHDEVLEAIIKELTEKKDNRITITDIEPKSSRIHYESKKDAEPLEESEWISVNDRMPEEFRRESKYIEFKTLSGMLIDGYSKRNAFYDSKYGSIITSIVTHWKYKNNEPKEESEWISVKDRMPPLHKDGNLPIVEILGEDNVTMEGYYCHIFGLWMTTHDTIVKVTHWKYRNK